MTAKRYDLIVIGSGCGFIAAEEAASRGWRVALVEMSKAGGTCLNVGCVPSKLLIAAADRAMDARSAGRVDVETTGVRVDFARLIARVRRSVRSSRREFLRGIQGIGGLDYYPARARFLDEHTVSAGDQTLQAGTVVIASGARPLIPPIEGLDSVPYLTNETVLELDTAPGSLVIIGGGYIAVEYAHLFAALGARVSLVEMLPRLMSSEEPEVSDLLYRQLSRRMKVYLNARAVSVKGGASRVSVTTEDAGGARRTLLAERLLVASGRRPNADLLEAENAGVTLDARGYVEVDRHLRTRTKHIYAVGDANGKAMFTHAANAQAYLMAERLLLGSRREFDLHTVPHAVFTRPQIASVGLTVAQAREQTEILVGRTGYRDIVGGEAIGEEEGFALAVVEKETRRILGFHIAGPQAPLLIQEVTNAMASGGGAGCIAAGMHIHPSLSELVDYTLNNLEEVNTGEGETALTESPARR